MYVIENEVNDSLPEIKCTTDVSLIAHKNLSLTAQKRPSMDLLCVPNVYPHSDRVKRVNGI